MVAYSFNPRFEPPILAGTKTQTIRSDRKRHARPDEMMQLYRSQRSPTRSKLLMEARCTGVFTVTILFEVGHISGASLAYRPVMDLEKFARLDGFDDLSDMSGFWRASHPEAVAAGRWSGVLLAWLPPQES